jgi:hypothetical protein
VKDFFCPGTEIAVVAKYGGKVRRILSRDAGDGPKKNREADGKDAFFAARENATTEVKGAQSRFLHGCGTKIVGNERDLFGLFGSGGYGFAELRKAEHGGRPVSHGA